MKNIVETVMLVTIYNLSCLMNVYYALILLELLLQYEFVFILIIVICRRQLIILVVTHIYGVSSVQDFNIGVFFSIVS